MHRIAEAVHILRAGGLVAFPTETVYGLGADATNADAVARIFTAKGRPPTNPVIVHVADEVAAKRYAGHWPDSAARLARRFWPGPLTLVVPRSESLALMVSAGRQSVGLRAPDHTVALQLLREFDGPIAAPSANRSTRISPTRAEHVRAELADQVDMILDGGPCRVGIESTVLDLSGPAPVILRQGAVTQAQIEAEIGSTSALQGSVDPAQAAASPGQHAIHYAPRALAIRFDPSQIDLLAKRVASQASGSHAIVWIGGGGLGNDRLGGVNFAFSRELQNNPEVYARELYAALREADQPGTGTIFVEMPPDEMRWAAIRDRLTRATKPL